MAGAAVASAGDVDALRSLCRLLLLVVSPVQSPLLPSLHAAHGTAHSTTEAAVRNSTVVRPAATMRTEDTKSSDPHWYSLCSLLAAPAHRIGGAQTDAALGAVAATVT